MKFTISFWRWSGSFDFQKSCIRGEVPARNAMTASVPHFGLIPSRMLAPPVTSRAPRSRYRHLGQGDFLGGGVLRKRLALLEVVDSAVEKEAAEDQAAEQERSFHRNILNGFRAYGFRARANRIRFARGMWGFMPLRRNCHELKSLTN